MESGVCHQAAPCVAHRPDPRAWDISVRPGGCVQVGSAVYVVKHAVQEIADENQGAEGDKLKRQQSAVQRATKVLLNRHAAPTAVVLTYLPWLISASPKHALSVLKVPVAPPGPPPLCPLPAHQPALVACDTLLHQQQHAAGNSQQSMMCKAALCSLTFTCCQS